jgi:hypothetical protein
MSYCRISGFFELSERSFNAYEAPFEACPTSGPPSLALFGHYRSNITGCTTTTLPVSIRAPRRYREGSFATGAVVHVVGNAFIQTGGFISRVDASEMVPICPDTSSPLYPCESLLPLTRFDVLGTVGSDRYFLGDGTAVLLFDVSQYVRNRTKRFHIACVASFARRVLLFDCPARCLLSPSKHDIEVTDRTPVGTRLFFTGTCSHVLPSGLLAIDADEVIGDRISTALHARCIEL